ncbi:unnamed protein product [Gadus morhua 'NCC']
MFTNPISGSPLRQTDSPGTPGKGAEPSSVAEWTSAAHPECPAGMERRGRRVTRRRDDLDRSTLQDSHRARGSPASAAKKTQEPPGKNADISLGLPP